MSDRETLERVVELGDRGSNVLTYEVLAAIYHMLNDHDSVLEDNTRLRAIKRSDTEMIEECRKELAELANNRDGLEHDWNERGERIDAALAEVGHSREMLLDDASPKLLLDNIELALKGEA